jgi:hypothetical protein
MVKKALTRATMPPELLSTMLALVKGGGPAVAAVGFVIASLHAARSVPTAFPPPYRSAATALCFTLFVFSIAAAISQMIRALLMP